METSNEPTVKATIRLPRKTMSYLRKIAEKEKRSVNNMVEVMINYHALLYHPAIVKEIDSAAKE